MKFFTLFVLIFILTGCSIRCHGDTILSLSSSPGVFTLDNKYAYIVVKPLYYQRAAGLCSFPDGGISKSIYTSLDLYKINVETGDIHKVYSLADQDLEGYTLNVGTSPNLFTTNKDNQYFYFKAMVLNTGDNSSDYLYYQVALSDGATKKISLGEYNNLSKDVRKIDNGSDKNAQGEYLTLFQENNIPRFVLSDHSKMTSRTILEGYSWLPYKF